MIAWTPKRRENAVKLLVNASTILLATLVVGNVVGGKPFNVWTFVLGLLLYVGTAASVLLIEE